MNYEEKLKMKSLDEYRRLHHDRIKELETSITLYDTIIGNTLIDIIKQSERIQKLETSLEHVLERLHALEEKERQRARDEHARAEALDFANSTGLSRQ